MNCVICEGPLPKLGATNTQSGKICKHCASKIPPVLSGLLDNFADYTLQSIIEYEDKVYDQFSATASYGSLHIDSVNGLFAISNKLNGDKPVERNVFSAYDLSEVALYCKSPKVDHNQVYVDVEFSAYIEHLRIPIKVIVKKKAHCQTKRTDSTHLSWEEPGDMKMFITMFNTMLSGLWEKMKTMLCGKTIHEMEVERARALFMLPPTYTLDELKKARNMMAKVYHPDVAEFDTTEAQKTINAAFRLLKQELE